MCMINDTTLAKHVIRLSPIGYYPIERPVLNSAAMYNSQKPKVIQLQAWVTAFGCTFQDNKYGIIIKSYASIRNANTSMAVRRRDEGVVIAHLLCNTLPSSAYEPVLGVASMLPDLPEGSVGVS